MRINKPLLIKISVLVLLVLLFLFMTNRLSNVSIEAAKNLIESPGTGERVLVWNDEFDQPNDSQVDTQKWKYQFGGDGWGNFELQYYTNHPQNSFIKEGVLHLQAVSKDVGRLPCWYGVCEYTSARITTKDVFNFQYGRIEARLKLPRGVGMWPTFWLIGSNIDEISWPNSGEIDMLDTTGNEPKRAYGVLHGPGYSGAKGLKVPYELPDGTDYADGFHLFAIEWSENKIQWFVDDKLIHTYTPDGTPKGTLWVYNHPFYLVLNLAVGGTWPGSPNKETIFPQSLDVDYVRVYQYR